jgi:hypothetical protein
MSIHPQENVRCGDDWFFAGPLNDNNGNPLNLTGATFLYNVDSLDGTENLFSTTTVTLLNSTTATVQWGAPAAETADIPPGTYYDTLQITLAAGAGTFTIVEGVINAASQPTSTQ